MTPVKAIKKFCLDCGGSRREAKACQKTGCALFPYRLGKNPARQGIGGLKTLPSWLKNPNSTMEKKKENPPGGVR